MRSRTFIRFVFAIAIVVVGVWVTHDSNSDMKLGQIGVKPVLFPIPNDQPSELSWFIHVTDLHLSKFKSGEERMVRFDHFLDETIPTIQPDFVVVTGDLCHGKEEDNMISGQFTEEWKMYRNALEKRGLFDYNFWIDLRGNHDCFDTGIKGKPNKDGIPFYDYSVTGFYYQKSVRAYTKHVSDVTSYSIVSLDACPPVGALSPLNFFGKMNRTELNYLEKTLKQYRKSNQTIVLGHYPLSTILSETSTSGNNLVGLLEKERVSYYLCGHLHTAFGPKLQARHSNSLIELELGDFKHNNLFRVMAIDHGMLSFVDQPQDTWPIILITNPKDAGYLSSNEPFEKSSLSSHIRLLIFSTSPILHIRVSIDDNIHYEEEVPPQDSPFFAIPWKPQTIGSGIHTIRVDATDGLMRQHSIEQPFSLDGTTRNFENYFKWILLGPVQEILIWGFVGMDIFVVVFLISIQFLDKNSVDNFFKRRCFQLKEATFLYIFLLISWSTLMFLPWFLGKICNPEHYGLVFFWGIVHFYEEGPQQFVVDYFHTMDTHLYTGFQLVNYTISLCYFWLFAGLTDKTFFLNMSRNIRAMVVLFVYIFSLFQIKNSFSIMWKIGSIYGWNSLILSPLVAWYNSIVILFIIYILIMSIVNAMKNPSNNTITTSKKSRKSDNKKKK